jgi:phosphate transport system substrate-binding protein
MGGMRNPKKPQRSKEAMNWGLTDGQSFAEGMGYIPLPETIVSKALQAVASVR